MNSSKSAALYYVPAGYTTSGPEIFGIQSASEGLLRGLVRHGGLTRLIGLGEHQSVSGPFARDVHKIDPKLAVEWVLTSDIGRLGEAGTLLLPGPGLSAYAWMRRRAGNSEFSLCGVTHTTATPGVLDALCDLLTAPVEPWDAVICTSKAVKSMVLGVIEEQRLYLKERFGQVPAGPQLPVIPLGIDTASFAPNPEARARLRGQLGLQEKDVGLLYVGRLSPFTKAHPIPLFLAVAAAALKVDARLHLFLAGWFPSTAIEYAFRAAAAQICPGVSFTILDGRKQEMRRDIWHAADIFMSPVDNVQETFGLTPLEAMAAGLPVIASDWDGYRETVRHGSDGFLIPTLAPPPRSSPDLAQGYGARTIDYDAYAGVSSQAVAVDIDAMADAIVSLAANPALRSTMGQSGRAHAARDFDWKAIMPRYRELWGELAARRLSLGGAPNSGLSYPARPDPFTAFSAYPARPLAAEIRVGIGRTSPTMLDVLFASPIVRFADWALPAAAELGAMIARVERGGTLVLDLLDTLPLEQRPMAWRGVAWLAKFGFIRVT